MKKKFIFLVSLILFTFLFATNAFAYKVNVYIPLNYTNLWYAHSTLDFSANAAASSAAGAWSNASPTNLKYTKSSTIKTGNIQSGDNQNWVGMVSFQASGLPSNAIGVNILCPDNNARIIEFDIVANTDYPLEYGSGTYDVQGIYTHEFGHSMGLADLYFVNTPVPTMYGYATYNGSIIYYSLRTLETDDILGKYAVYNLMERR